MISIDDFKKVEMRVGKVLEALRVEGSEKLLKLRVDIGGDSSTGSSIELSQMPSGQAERQIIAGVGKQYEPEALVGRSIVIVTNLEPRSLMGLESQGMLLAASLDDTIAILGPDKNIPPGSILLN